MNIHEIISELRKERELIDNAIAHLKRLSGPPSLPRLEIANVGGAVADSHPNREDP
jgi:hypothetical protein